MSVVNEKVFEKIENTLRAEHEMDKTERVVASKQLTNTGFGEPRPKIAITAQFKDMRGNDDGPRFDMRLRLYAKDIEGKEYLGAAISPGSDVPGCVWATMLAELAMAWGWDGGDRKKGVEHLHNAAESLGKREASPMSCAQGEEIIGLLRRLSYRTASAA